uniref:ubiquitinyl hydrolase 1 n=1 Tax=Eptatretus burgeri TaxID=7764 RepID=A0A8C4QQ14_EPTBU
MNAVLQCLSNTDLLAEFLGLGQYKADLRADSPPDSPLLQAQVLLQAPSLRATSSSSSSFSVAASTNGTPRPPRPHGEVTEQLATLVRALWTLEYTPQLSSDFKHVVARYASQFRGSSQQDAQEFLLWLLDRVHEDLNNSNTVPGTRSPLVVESWSGEENDGEDMETGLPYFGKSFVQELFQAQYRSSLTCPHCQKQSNTFDPFLCISLPIPLRQTRIFIWGRERSHGVLREEKASYCQHHGRIANSCLDQQRAFHQRHSCTLSQRCYPAALCCIPMKKKTPEIEANSAPPSLVT